MPARRVILDSLPAVERPAANIWDRGFWRAKWVRLPNDPQPPFVTAYRLRFRLEAAATVRIHVGADERYILFSDYKQVGRGNDRADLGRWFYDSYELELGRGPHELFAYVWSFGGEGEFKAAHAQMTLQPGFLLGSDTHPEIETGTGAWEVARLSGFEFLSPLAAWGIGPRLRIVGEPTGPGGMDRGAEWVLAESDVEGRHRGGANGVFPTRLLVPSIIPAQQETELVGWEAIHVSSVPSRETAKIAIRTTDHLASEAETFAAMSRGEGAFSVPAGEVRRVLVRFPQYACVYPRVKANGGAGSMVRVHVQEALFEEKATWRKGDRRESEGKFFTTLWHDRDGIGDEFGPRGFRQDFVSFDWLAGLWAEVVIDGGEKGTALWELGFTETRYPLELDGWPTTEDAEFGPILGICRRGLEMSAHETFIDCAYERMQYVWDARIEGLCAMVFGADDRLVRKAIMQFADSLGPDGMIASRHPARERQVIAPFGLHFVGMLHDFARWRGDSDFVSEFMPTARAILEHHSRRSGRTAGWNFVDWVPAWPNGMPPEDDRGGGPILTLLYQLAKRQMSELEDWTRLRETPTVSTVPEWVWTHGPEDLRTTEHWWALATLLERKVPMSWQLSASCTFSFAHLLFEAYTASERTDLLHSRILKDWGGMVRDGLTTTIEQPEPTRSDCHGWGAHAAYHALTGFLGLRPLGLGGERFSLTPALPFALEASAFTSHGPIHLRGVPGRVEVEVPRGVVVVAGDLELTAGRHVVEG